jgi:MFS family permease
MGVYRPELFPTGLRGRSAGLIEVVTVAGSALGLIVVGELADRWDQFAGPLSIFALGSLAIAGLVLIAYPETAQRSLEELNPEDRAVDAVP